MKIISDKRENKILGKFLVNSVSNTEPRSTSLSSFLLPSFFKQPIELVNVACVSTGVGLLTEVLAP